jgi:hypothetical protein
MKLLTLIAITIVSVSTITHAEQICKTQDNLGVHYQLNYTADSKLYKVWYYGHSRNNYEAIYKIINRRAMGSGYVDILVKLKDLSTWKDMPERLLVLFQAYPATYILRNSKGQEVQFPAIRCEQSQVGIKQQRTDFPSNWCHTPGKSKLC